MAKIYEGTIDKVYKNYGLLSSKIDDNNVKLYFYVISSMFDDNKKFKLSKKVNFKIKKISIRKSFVYIAYDLKNIEKTNSENVKTNYENFEINHYSNLYLTLTNSTSINKNIVKKLIILDEELKSFVLESVLFLEKNTKNVICSLANNLYIDKYEFFQKIININDSTFKNVITNAIKEAKQNYLFLPEFNNFIIDISSEDVTDIKIKYAPIEYLLESMSLTDFAIFIKHLAPLFKVDKKIDSIEYLNLVSDIFQDLSLIRNKSAHGNPLLPTILDYRFNANYFYEMANVFPSWTTHENIENYPLFNYIRFQIRYLIKGGFVSINSGSPMLSALTFTKTLLISPAKRSFFSLFYILFCYQAFIDDSKELKKLLNKASKFVYINDNTKKQFADYFPNEDNSIKMQLSMLVLPIIVYDKNKFKLFCSIS